MKPFEEHAGLRVAVVDYGAGNLVSIEQALTFVGAQVRIATEPEELEGAEAVIVPGVGAAGPAMQRLTRARLVDPLLRWIALGRPYLGICLGLQLLFDGSDEDGATTLRGHPWPGRAARGRSDAPHISAGTRWSCDATMPCSPAWRAAPTSISSTQR